MQKLVCKPTIPFIGEDYRIGRRTGKVERLPSGGGAPVPAGFNESMTLFDVLCSSLHLKKYILQISQATSCHCNICK